MTQIAGKQVSDGPEQDRSMGRLAEILRENGVDVFQWEPCGYEDCDYQEKPTIWLVATM